MENFSNGVFIYGDKRRIVVSGDIKSKTQEAVCRAITVFEMEPEKEIIIFIDSFGGGIMAGQMLFDAIRLSPASITGVVTGKAHSAGFVTLQACKKRVAYPNARLMNHSPELVGLRIDQPDLERCLQNLRALHEKLLSYLVARSKVSMDQLRAWSIAETDLSAQEVLEAGLIDEIYEPS